MSAVNVRQSALSHPHAGRHLHLSWQTDDLRVSFPVLARTAGTAARLASSSADRENHLFTPSGTRKVIESKPGPLFLTLALELELHIAKRRGRIKRMEEQAERQ